MFCEKCGSQKFLGKGSDSKKKWCPACEGFEVLSKQESINFCNEGIKETGKELKRLTDIFESNSLIITLLVTREGILLPTLKGFGFDAFGYVSLTDLISKVLNKESKGTKECYCLDPDFQKLIHLAKAHYEDLNISMLIKKNLAGIIRVPRSSLRSTSFDYDTYERIYKIKPEELDQDPVEIVKFHDDWEDIRDNLRENGFISSNEAHIIQIENENLDQLFEAHFEAIQTKISLDLSNGSKLFSQPKFRDNLEYLDLLDTLGDIFYFYLDGKTMSPPEFTCSLRPIDKKNFDNIITSLEYDVSKVYDLLVSSKGQKITFPLIYEFDNELLVPPLTLKLFKKLLSSLYSKELNVTLSKDGYLFEKEVASSLETIGLNIDQPNDCTKKLVSIVDDIEDPTLQIDIVAYDYRTKKLFVIDCKNIIFNTTFISGTREKDVRDRLKEQPEKQRKRIEYMKNNLALFGLSSKKIKKYVSVLVTANKEPIDKLENCHIIPLREIYKIKDLEPI